MDDGLEFLANRLSGAAHVYTRLTQNIASVVRRLDPTPDELQRRELVLTAVSRAVYDSFPEYRGVAKVRFRPLISFPICDFIALFGFRNPSRGASLDQGGTPDWT
jgi:hypothetical protein